MKCMYKNFQIFSSILKIHINKISSFSLFKKTIISLTNKKILLRHRFSSKTPFFYYLNAKQFLSLNTYKKSKLYFNIILISPSLFNLYLRRYPLILPKFNLSLLQKQYLFIKNNLNSILQNSLNTSIQNFSSDFRQHLKNYNKNINLINTYKKFNGLTHKTNYSINSNIMMTPDTTQKQKKISFYPRYLKFFS